VGPYPATISVENGLLSSLDNPMIGSVPYERWRVARTT